MSLLRYPLRTAGARGKPASLPGLRLDRTDPAAVGARAAGLLVGLCLIRCLCLAGADGWLLWRRGVRAHLSRFHRLDELLASRPRRTETLPAATEAAVALVCVPDPDAILLIRRSERAGDPWSGQMGLPGGRRDHDDPDLLHTAIRETAEEVGVRLSRAALIGTLDDLLPRTSLLPRILVRPFVFQLPSRVPLQPNPEVAASAWVDLAQLLQPGVYREWEVQAGGQSFRYPGYRLGEGIVWGMTERILTPFLSALPPG